MTVGFIQNPLERAHRDVANCRRVRGCSSSPWRQTFWYNEMAKKDVPEIAEYTSSDATSTVEKKKKTNN